MRFTALPWILFFFGFFTLSLGACIVVVVVVVVVAVVVKSRCGLVRSGSAGMAVIKLEHNLR